MTHWTEASALIEGQEDRAQGFLARYAPGALAFALSASLGVYLVYFRAPVLVPAAPPELAAKPDANAFGGLAPLVPPPSVALARKPDGNPFGALVTKGFGTSDRFGFTVAQAPVPTPPVPPSDLRTATDDDAGVPLPPRRPSALARQSDEAAPAPSVVARLEPRPALPPPPSAAPEAPAGPGIFEKLFGGGSTAARSPDTRLAYAAPPPSAVTSGSSALAARGGLGSPGGFGGFLSGLNIGSGSNPATRYGDHVAVYDISARVVYLPDGTKLEAHSGLGSLRDDPSGVSTRMKGPTPPATYALTPREELFHGVPALRLTPIDSNVYGRAGLLAHTYMLGPDGDSNGCISFRDYDAFLNAYRSGKISKIVVVTRL
jgi:hypothetical protein